MDDLSAIQKRLAGDRESFRQLAEKYEGRAVGCAHSQMRQTVRRFDTCLDLTPPAVAPLVGGDVTEAVLAPENQCDARHDVCGLHRHRSH